MPAIATFNRAAAANRVAENIREADQKKGQILRKADVQIHIDKIEERKKDLQAKGRELLSEGKQDTPEYDALVEQHRFLRGKQRFLEGAQEDIGTDKTESGQASNKDRTKQPEKMALEKGSDALDRLYKDAQ